VGIVLVIVNTEKFQSLPAEIQKSVDNLSEFKGTTSVEAQQISSAILQGLKFPSYSGKGVNQIVRGLGPGR